MGMFRLIAVVSICCFILHAKISLVGCYDEPQFPTTLQRLEFEKFFSGTARYWVKWAAPPTIPSLSCLIIDAEQISPSNRSYAFNIISVFNDGRMSSFNVSGEAFQGQDKYNTLHLKKYSNERTTLPMFQSNEETMGFAYLLDAKPHQNCAVVLIAGAQAKNDESWCGILVNELSADPIACHRWYKNCTKTKTLDSESANISPKENCTHIVPVKVK